MAGRRGKSRGGGEVGDDRRGPPVSRAGCWAMPRAWPATGRGECWAAVAPGPLWRTAGAVGAKRCWAARELGSGLGRKPSLG
jgi:hypothetical protein